jgi:alkyl sulfatase BDS1-like metallo-beta-lactamase superfamily hydrolase
MFIGYWLLKVLTKFLKIYTKHRQRQPLPVIIHTIDFAIHNGSVVGIVTLI